MSGMLELPVLRASFRHHRAALSLGMGLALGLSGCTEAASLAPPERNLPALVTDFVEEHRRDCQETGGRFVGPTPLRRGDSEFSSDLDLDGDGVVTYYETVDLNGDGEPDYILTPAHAFVCEFSEEDGAWSPSAMFFRAGRCGQDYRFIVSGPTGYRHAGDTCASMLEVAELEGRTVLELSGTTDDNVAIWGWTGDRVDLLHIRRPNGARVDRNGRPITTRSSAANDRPATAAEIAAIAEAAAIAATNAASSPTPEPLPIRTGYWGNCDGSGEAIYYDGRRIAYLGHGTVHFWKPVGQVDASDGEYFLEDHHMLITPLDEDRIRLSIQDEMTLRHCPDNRTSATVRTTISRLSSR